MDKNEKKACACVETTCGKRAVKAGCGCGEACQCGPACACGERSSTPR